MLFLESLWKYLVVSSTYLLLGFFLSGLLKAFVSVETVKKWLGGKSLWPIFKAALVGVPLPLCSCSVIPSAVTLKKAGASNGAVSSFLISTPESGVDSMSITYALMDIPMTIFRPVAAFISGFLAGILQYFFNKEKEEVQETAVEKPHTCCCHNHEVAPKVSLLQRLKLGLSYAFGDLIDDVAFWMAIGILIGASIDFFLPPDVFAGANGWAGRLIVLSIGIPLYICASASTPVAASLIMKGMSPGTAIIFLLAGPATNVTNILVLQKYLGKKGVMLNLISIIFVSLAMSWFVDFFYQYFALPVHFHIASHEHMPQVSFLEISSAILFSLLLLKGLYVKEIRSRFFKKTCCH